MRPVLKEEDRRTRPWTSYPFPKRKSASQEPSCPVIPVIKAFFSFEVFFLFIKIPFEASDPRIPFSARDRPGRLGFMFFATYSALRLVPFFESLRKPPHHNPAAGQLQSADVRLGKTAGFP